MCYFDYEEHKNYENEKMKQNKTKKLSIVIQKKKLIIQQIKHSSKHYFIIK